MLVLFQLFVPISRPSSPVQRGSRTFSVEFPSTVHVCVIVEAFIVCAPSRHA